MTQTNKRILIAIVVLAIAVGLFLVSRPHDRVGRIEYKLAVLIPETGNFAFVGQPFRNVLKIAEDKHLPALKEAGIHLQLVFADTQGNPKEAATAFNRLADVDKVQGVLTSLSGVTSAVAPLAKDRSMLMMGVTIDPAFLKDQQTAFRFQFSAAREGEKLAALALSRGWQRVLVLYSTDASTVHVVTRNLAPKLEGASVKVVMDTFTPGQRDFNSLCGKYAREKWDAVVYHGFGTDLPFLVEACNVHSNLAAASKMCAVGCLDAPPEKRAVLAGAQLFGPVFYARPTAEVEAFYKTYAERYPGQTLPWHSLYAYDAYTLLANALIKERTIDAQKLKAAFLRPNPALTVTYQFGPDGDFVPDSELMEFDQTGKVRPVASGSK